MAPDKAEIAGQNECDGNLAALLQPTQVVPWVDTAQFDCEMVEGGNMSLNT